MAKGGLTTKIHALVDGQGLPIRLRLTAGQSHDGQAAKATKRQIAKLTIQPATNENSGQCAYVGDSAGQISDTNHNPQPICVGAVP